MWELKNRSRPLPHTNAFFFFLSSLLQRNAQQYLNPPPRNNSRVNPMCAQASRFFPFFELRHLFSVYALFPSFKLHRVSLCVCVCFCSCNLMQASDTADVQREPHPRDHHLAHPGHRSLRRSSKHVLHHWVVGLGHGGHGLHRAVCDRVSLVRT